MLKLDKMDLRILAVLQGEGRISKTELAATVNLSPAACWERLRRLEESGAIRGYRAEVALEKLVRHSTMLVTISLRHHTKEDFSRFERAIQKHDNILDCWATGGGIDYIIRVLARDIQEYQSVIDELLTANLGIDRYYTYVVTRPIKVGSRFPLTWLIDREPDR